MNGTVAADTANGTTAGAANGTAGAANGTADAGVNATSDAANGTADAEDAADGTADAANGTTTAADNATGTGNETAGDDVAGDIRMQQELPDSITGDELMQCQAYLDVWKAVLASSFGNISVDDIVIEGIVVSNSSSSAIEQGIITDHFPPSRTTTADDADEIRWSFLETEDHVGHETAFLETDAHAASKKVWSGRKIFRYLYPLSSFSIFSTKQTVTTSS